MYKLVNSLGLRHVQILYILLGDVLMKKIIGGKVQSYIYLLSLRTNCVVDHTKQ